MSDNRLQQREELIDWLYNEYKIDVDDGILYDYHIANKGFDHKYVLIVTFVGYQEQRYPNWFVDRSRVDLLMDAEDGAKFTEFAESSYGFDGTEDELLAILKKYPLFKRERGHLFEWTSRLGTTIAAREAEAANEVHHYDDAGDDEDEDDYDPEYAAEDRDEHIRYFQEQWNIDLTRGFYYDITPGEIGDTPFYLNVTPIDYHNGVPPIDGGWFDQHTDISIMMDYEDGRRFGEMCESVYEFEGTEQEMIAILNKYPNMFVRIRLDMDNEVVEDDDDEIDWDSLN